MEGSKSVWDFRGKKLEKIVGEFNSKLKGSNHFEVLELEENHSYFVLALSCKEGEEGKEWDETVSYLFEKMISLPLYVGECWYLLVGDKARVKRQLFTYSVREYSV